jgi:hypothetical protein
MGFPPTCEATLTCDIGISEVEFLPSISYTEDIVLYIAGLGFPGCLVCGCFITERAELCIIYRNRRRRDKVIYASETK